MNALVLIPWAATEWTASGRLTAQTRLPLTAEGRAMAESWGRSLSARKLECIFTSDELTSRETAAAVAQAAGARVRTLSGIEEVNCGLWAGLTDETLRSRFPKAYKRWKEDPTSVCPPEGEDVTDAAERIREALRSVQRKAQRAGVGVVLGPLALAITRCVIAGEPLSGLRALLASEPVEFDNYPIALQAAAPQRDA